MTLPQFIADARKLCDHYELDETEVSLGRALDMIEVMQKGIESILVYEAYGCGCNSVAKETLAQIEKLAGEKV